MSNEATLLEKYASEVFVGLVAPVADGLQVSAGPANDLLAKEDVLVRMNHELKRALESSTELIIILVIVTLLFGVGRIGKIASELGSGIRSFKEGLNGDKENNQ